MTRTARNLIASAALLVAAGASATALAGYRSNTEVYVNSASRIAYGSQGSARNSSDSTQYIGCALHSYSGYSTPRVSCYANNAAGVYVSCTSASAGLAGVVSNMTSESFIRFEYDASGECTYIRSLSSSYIPPKSP